MILLRSLIFNLLFYPFSLLYPAVMLPCLLTRRSTHWGIRLWVYSSLWLMRVVLNLNYRLILKAELPQQVAIYASKHQSAWETIALWVLVPNPIFVMKRELYRIPFIGWWIRRAGNIAINRKAGMGAVKQLLREARLRLEEGYNIIIFPEGTRTAPGTTTDYLPGVTALYKNLNVPVVPIALNSGSYWPRNAFTKYPGTITVSMLQPILAKEDSKIFHKILQERIENALSHNN